MPASNTRIKVPTKARGERVYKPGGKKEWRVVFWTHDAVKPNRRQCSFSEAKYGKEAASLLSRAVLDYIDVKGVIPDDLHDPPILDPAKKELIEYYSALHESRRSRIKKSKNKKSYRNVDSIVPLYTLTNNQDHRLFNHVNKNESRKVNNYDSPLSITTVNNTNSPNSQSIDGDKVSFQQASNILPSQLGKFNSFDISNKKINNEDEVVVDQHLCDLNLSQFPQANLPTNIQDINMDPSSLFNIDVQSLINHTFQQMMYQSHFQLVNELSLSQFVFNKANIPFPTQLMCNLSDNNPQISSSACIFPTVSNHSSPNKLDIYSGNKIVGIKKNIHTR